MTDARLTTLIWAALMAVALFLRPLLPIDETRYITVAWEMWTSGDFIVPTLNGQVYSHKPPFLFWLMHLGWNVFGVSELWARMVAPLFGLGSLWLTALVGRALWPDMRERAALAPLMMVTGVYWAVFSTMTMFDMLVTFAAILAVLGIVKMWQGFISDKGFWWGVAIAGLGIGIGGLAKGPAVLVHVLPVALLAPIWGPHMGLGRGDGAVQREWKYWYLGVFAALVLGIAITLLWAIPAAILGGAEYRDAIFIKQSADRMVKSFAHRRPFYWFMWVLPLLLLPWSLWPQLWKKTGSFRNLWADGSVRFLALWAGASFIIFSAISGKQPHYLLPIFPALALFAAYQLTKNNQMKPFGHRVPVLFLSGLSLLLILGLSGQDTLQSFSAKPLPAWFHSAEPAWLGVALILSVFLATRPAKSIQTQVHYIAISAASVLVFLHLAAAPALDLAYNLEPAAKRVKAFEDEGRPVAYIGKYHGEFHFLGRLTKPLPVFQTMIDGKAWAKQNPTGVLIATKRAKDIPAVPAPLSSQPYRGKFMVFWNAADFN